MCFPNSSIQLFSKIEFQCGDTVSKHASVICFPDMTPKYQLLLKSRKIHLLPPPYHYTASTWTGALLIYIIIYKCSDIPLYQVNYAPYLILILLWEPGSVSASPGAGVTTKCPLGALHSYPRLWSRSVWDTSPSLAPFNKQQRRHCCYIFYNVYPTRGDLEMLVPPAAAQSWCWDKLIEYVSARGGLKTFIIQPEKTPIWPHQILTYQMKKNFKN